MKYTIAIKQIGYIEYVNGKISEIHEKYIDNIDNTIPNFVISYGNNFHTFNKLDGVRYFLSKNLLGWNNHDIVIWCRNYNDFEYENMANDIIKTITSIDPKNVEEHVLGQILHKDIDTDTLFKYLSDVDGDLYTVILMEIANVIYDNNLKLTHDQKEVIKKYTLKNDNLNQNMILSFILEEKIGIDLNMNQNTIHFFPKVKIKTMLNVLTPDEIEHYFKYYTGIDKITSLEMFKVLIKTSEFFREFWSHDIDFDIITSIKNSALKYFTPEFLLDSWSHIHKSTQKKLYKLFYDEYQFDDTWANTLRKITPESKDMI